MIEQLQVFNINSRMKGHQINWLQHLERMEQNIFPKLLSYYKPRGKDTKGVPVKDGENSFECNSYNFKP
jgi:hypothetical protein